MAVNQDDLVDQMNQRQETTDHAVPESGEVSDIGVDQESQDEVTEKGVNPEVGKEDDSAAVPYGALKAEREKWQRRMEGMEAKLT